MAVLHTHRFGDPDGAPLLAVHGITAHGRRFHRLAEEGWPERRTLAVDLRGHGRSTYHGPWNVQQHVSDLLDTLDAFEVERADVVGHSYGGMIALALLARAPERVRTISLLDPALAVAPETADAGAASGLDDPGFATVEEALDFRTGGDPAIRATAEIEITDHLERGDDGRYRFRFHRPAAVTGWGEMCAPLPDRVEARPALLVAATKAPFVTPAIEDGLLRLFGEQLTTVHIDCGHLLYWERFADTVAAVVAFLTATS